MTRSPKILPPWLLGWGYLPFAVNAAVSLIAIPDLLASSHVPEAQIATVTSLYLAGGFLVIPISPLLDWRFSRRSYAIAFAVLTALCTFGALILIPNAPLFTATFFLSGITSTMYANAVGGWFGDLVPTEKKDSLGGWFQAVNFGGTGVAAALVIYLLRLLPQLSGQATVGALTLLGLPLLLLTPCPPADRRLASESFRNFARDVGLLFRRKNVHWALAIFLAPSASFALTNTISGFGQQFHTSDEMVGVLAGAGGAAAGALGALLVPRLTRRISPVALYLLVGLVGAAFTLSLIAAPRDPAMFGVASLGEFFLQGAAFSAANVITFRVIGHDNPLAATQFGVLIGASQIPLTYMQMIDGHAYDFGGIAGTFGADALISGAACVILGLLYWRSNSKIAVA